MPQHPAAHPPRTDPRTPPPIPPATPARDLTVNKVLAGAGAAATSAVLGSYFGAAGTVAGAALGSVASTLAATIYRRYLDRTRDTIVARIRPVADGSSAGELTLPMQRTGDEETVRLRVEPVVPPAPARRRWWMWVGATVLVFVIGLLAVTGIEWVKGSTLTSGDSGTSVGRVLGSDNGTAAEPATAPAAPADGSTSDATPDPTTAPSSTAEPGRDQNGSSDPTTSDVPSVEPSVTNTPGLPGLLNGTGPGG